jgi:hypothetical protein
MVIGCRLVPGACGPKTNPCETPVRRRPIMSHELIRSCLRLPADRWPPDHYTLLGLEPREADTGRIEQRVQERMEQLRRYQLTHAEQVTEGMNRLAQALVCLTDPVAKQAYDALLPAKRPARPSRLRRFSHTQPESVPEPPFRSRRVPRWLLLAWSLWLSVGLGGLVALIRYFPDIEASYSGAREGVKAAKKLKEPTAAVPLRTGQRGP